MTRSLLVQSTGFTGLNLKIKPQYMQMGNNSVINIRNGQSEKIIANLVKDQDGEQSSDLTQFIISQDKTIIQGHHQEITNIRLDFRNGLLLSTGWDYQNRYRSFWGKRFKFIKCLIIEHQLMRNQMILLMKINFQISQMTQMKQRSLKL
eukprot:403357355